jgi:diadenosine tetraphosphate (Ap4A) HIT family hydrolase
MEYKEDCFSCNVNSGKIEITGGRIMATKYWLVEPSTESLTFGTLVVKPFRHCTKVSELTEEESEEMGLILRGVSKILDELFNPAQIYVTLWSHFGWERQHLHFFIQPIPPYLKDELSETGPFLQASLLNQNLKFSEEEIIKFANRVRSKIRTDWNDLFGNRLKTNDDSYLETKKIRDKEI